MPKTQCAYAEGCIMKFVDKPGYTCWSCGCNPNRKERIPELVTHDAAKCKGQPYLYVGDGTQCTNEAVKFGYCESHLYMAARGCLPPHPDGLSSEEEIARLRGRGEHSELLEEIRAEMDRQVKKWGVQDHEAERWLAILGEEFGEVSKAIVEYDLDAYRSELTQVAAVAIAAIECLDRNADATP